MPSSYATHGFRQAAGAKKPHTRPMSPFIGRVGVPRAIAAFLVPSPLPPPPLTPSHPHNGLKSSTKRQIIANETIKLCMGYAGVPKAIAVLLLVPPVCSSRSTPPEPTNGLDSAGAKFRTYATRGILLRHGRSSFCWYVWLTQEGKLVHSGHVTFRPERTMFSTL